MCLRKMWRDVLLLGALSLRVFTESLRGLPGTATEAKQKKERVFSYHTILSCDTHVVLRIVLLTTVLGPPCTLL